MGLDFSAAMRMGWAVLKGRRHLICGPVVSFIRLGHIFISTSALPCHALSLHRSHTERAESCPEEKRTESKKRRGIGMAGKRFPSDFYVDILARLPVKSLLRFMCVCKSWYNLIFGDRSFRAMQSNSVARRSPNSYVVLWFGDLALCDGSFVKYHQLHEQLDAQRRLKIKTVLLVGCHDGVVCFLCTECNGQPDLYLWNPSIRKLKALPPSPDYSPFNYFPWHWPAFGFGFCQQTEDYKVVIIHRGRDKFRVDIHSLAKGSWKQIERVDPGYDIPSTEHAFFKGASHWIDDDSKFIMYFRYGNETLGEMDLPDISPPAWELSMGVFKDSLSLLTSPIAPPGHDMLFCVWVMTEYGNKESWSKLFSVEQESFAWPLCFGNSGSVFIGKRDVDNNIDVVVEADETGIIQEITRGSPRLLDAVPYSESLLLLG